MREPCYKCKFENKPIDQEPCEHCSDEYIESGDHPAFQWAKSPINYDRLRMMSIEELAEFIGGDPMHDICPNNCQNDLDRPCKVCALDWLRQESKKEEIQNGREIHEFGFKTKKLSAE